MNARENAGSRTRPGKTRLALTLLCGTVLGGIPVAAFAQDAAPAAAAPTTAVAPQSEVIRSIAISGVAVLTYYAITNAAVLTLRREQRRWSPAIAVVGLAGCIALIASLPPMAILTGTAALALGVAVRAITRRPTP